MKRMILFILVLFLVFSVTASAVNIKETNGTAIPFAKTDSVAYFSMQFVGEGEYTATVTPNGNHLLDDNEKWGNFKEIEVISLEKGETLIKVFSVKVPAGANPGTQTWTITVSSEAETVIKTAGINLPVTKNVVTSGPTFSPEILIFTPPEGVINTIAMNSSEKKVVVSLLKVAGDFTYPKTFEFDSESEFPSDRIKMPETVRIEFSEPKKWAYENSEYLPFTVFPIICVIGEIDSPGSFFDLNLKVENKDSGKEAILPLRIVINEEDQEVKTREEPISLDDTNISVIKAEANTSSNSTEIGVVAVKEEASSKVEPTIISEPLSKIDETKKGRFAIFLDYVINIFT